MDIFWEVAEAIWAYGVALRDQWPAIGIGAAVGWVLLQMMQHRHIRRWVARRRLRGHIVGGIACAFAFFVSGSAYVELYRSTRVEQDLTLHFDTPDYKRLFEADITFDVYASNNGNRNILVQDISLYAIEYQTDTTPEAYALPNKCLTIGFINPRKFSMSIVNNKFVTMNGNLVQHVPATSVYHNGKEDKSPSFSVGAQSSHVARYIFRKKPYTNTNGNRLSLCFAISFFDAKANQLSAVCRGPEVTLVPTEDGNGIMTMPAIGQYKLLPTLDPKNCEAMP